ncbi:uncharacterized protein C10orf143 homolog isoform X2 [Sphaerodactylus townsendi]|uniref:uncharacterized protein C10orf143 homolog isoform X2 n=1 Tax=Sphaerodactylus townsendi TaxID=933632 RepID=UPI0020265B16|nr:uncharacterized protein C10orf143 homolog isoform X2 [Sphaerodactylus townsendi]
MSVLAERRRRSELYLPQPECKRICKSLETTPQDIVCHLPRKNPMDCWDMEHNLKQKRPVDLLSPQIMKEKPNSMIFPDNETTTTAQPCPRCIAGEPGHLGHIMGF